MADSGKAETGLSIVKLGGSVLTRKTGAGGVRPKLLSRLTAELATAPGPLVLLHGAGSFGHPEAARWGLAMPPEASGGRERTRGASIVSREVRRLHAEVLSATLRAGLSPISYPPLSIAQNHAGGLERFDTTPISEGLSRGGVPVSFGDVVPDRVWSWSILSADVIARHLARALGARRVLFVSDVAGILEAGTGRRKVIASPNAETLRGLQPPAAERDVTGGIRAKLEAMLAIAEGGCDAGLISGLTDGALSRALRGERVYGSWVHGRS